MDGTHGPRTLTHLQFGCESLGTFPVAFRILLFVPRARDETAMALSLQQQDNLFHTSRRGPPGKALGKYHGGKSASNINQHCRLKKKKVSPSSGLPHWQLDGRSGSAVDYLSHRRLHLACKPSKIPQIQVTESQRFFSSFFSFVITSCFRYIPIQWTRFK